MLFLGPNINNDFYNLINFVCKFLTNLAEQLQARIKFKIFKIIVGTTFWEFYYVFRTTAMLAGFRDDLTFRTNLRNKFLPRLRMKLTQE